MLSIKPSRYIGIPLGNLLEAICESGAVVSIPSENKPIQFTGHALERSGWHAPNEVKRVAIRQ
jgi:hypothetical protein